MKAADPETTEPHGGFQVKATAWLAPGGDAACAFAHTGGALCMPCHSQAPRQDRMKRSIAESLDFTFFFYFRLGGKRGHSRATRPRSVSCLSDAELVRLVQAGERSSEDVEIRCLRVSPGGEFLASGDRHGNVRPPRLARPTALDCGAGRDPPDPDRKQLSVTTYCCGPALRKFEILHVPHTRTRTVTRAGKKSLSQPYGLHI